jgi:N-acetylmuramoyl-L-alanine amidase
MATATVLLFRGAHGAAVRDLQARLNRLGFGSADAIGHYGAGTEAAVGRFQEHRGLRIDGICGPQTWASVVEAGWRLGDRLLYLRAPMLRGDDVGDLQERLGRLGFHHGRVDGILGPATDEALRKFQRNAGLTTDGICGPDTVEALHRFSDRAAGEGRTAGEVVETTALVDERQGLAGARIAIGETGGLGALADALGRGLADRNAVVAVLHDPDESTQATDANEFGAEAFVALTLVDDPGCATAYYATQGFESRSGRYLADLLLVELPPEALGPRRDSQGMRLPILRETRMPAVLCEVGPPSQVVVETPLLAAAFTRALARWSSEPPDLG